jgi:hypothetical protein
MLVASTSVFGFKLHYSRGQLLANAAIAASRVGCGIFHGASGQAQRRASTKADIYISRPNAFL